MCEAVGLGNYCVQLNVNAQTGMSHYMLCYMQFVICQVLAFAAVCDSLKLKMMINDLTMLDV